MKRLKAVCDDNNVTLNIKDKSLVIIFNNQQTAILYSDIEEYKYIDDTKELTIYTRDNKFLKLYVDKDEYLFDKLLTINKSSKATICTEEIPLILESGATKKKPFKLFCIYAICIAFVVAGISFICFMLKGGKPKSLEERMLGIYSNGQVAIQLKKNGECVVIAVNYKGDASCSWKTVGYFDFESESVNLEESPEKYPWAKISVNDSSIETTLNVFFLDNFSSFMDANNFNLYKRQDVKNIDEVNFTDDVEVKQSLKFGKLYTILQTGNGKKAYITFNENGTCNPLFSTLNNGSRLSGGVGSMYIFYGRDNQPCTYSIADDIISVSWLGTYEQVYEYKLGNGQVQSATIGQDFIMKDVKFKYYADGDYIDVINGKWDVQQGEGFFMVYFVKDTEDQNYDFSTNQLNDEISDTSISDTSGDYEPKSIEEAKLYVSTYISELKKQYEENGLDFEEFINSRGFSNEAELYYSLLESYLNQ